MDYNIRQRVSELQITINSAQNELWKLQSECPHTSYHIAMYMWRVGAFHPSRICDDCDASIPGITDEESKKVYDQWGQPITGTTTIIEGDENTPTVSFFSTAGSKS